MLFWFAYLARDIPVMEDLGLKLMLEKMIFLHKTLLECIQTSGSDQSDSGNQQADQLESPKCTQLMMNPQW